MRASLAFLALLGTLVALSEPALARPTGVLLQGLDKITGRTFAFEAPFEERVNFGPLEIIARACVAQRQLYAPERKAFIEIYEDEQNAGTVRIFSGWMFASSPSVSAMEHPVYDVWVVGCAGVPGDSLNKDLPTLEALQDQEESESAPEVPED